MNFHITLYFFYLSLIPIILFFSPVQNNYSIFTIVISLYSQSKKSPKKKETLMCGLTSYDKQSFAQVTRVVHQSIYCMENTKCFSLNWARIFVPNLSFKKSRDLPYFVWTISRKVIEVPSISKNLWKAV